MTLLKPLPIRSDRFTNTEDMLVIERSDLGRDFERVWDDACDVGLTVVSAMNGRETVYAVEHEERHDGDILYWDLRPVARVNPLLPAPAVRVYND